MCVCCLCGAVTRGPAEGAGHESEAGFGKSLDLQPRRRGRGNVDLSQSLIEVHLFVCSHSVVQFWRVKGLGGAFPLRVYKKGANKYRTTQGYFVLYHAQIYH